MATGLLVLPPRTGPGAAAGTAPDRESHGDALLGA